MRVEIWSDVVCPWCFIGKRRFERAIEVLRAKGITEPIEIVYRAFQLDPTAPIGNPAPVVEAYAKKFGGQERAEQILTHVTKVAAADDIEFNMDIALRANTIMAHRALHWALETYGPDVQSNYKETLLTAYFTDGLDVGDTTVLKICADRMDLDGTALESWLQTDNGTQAVLDDLQAAQDRDIMAVPSFVIDNRFLIPGAQDVDVFVNVLERALAR
ncbi:MAG: DsbA family oxidoreductase [Ilumatobacteraceae bacterium]